MPCIAIAQNARLKVKYTDEGSDKHRPFISVGQRLIKRRQSAQALTYGQRYS